MNKVEAYGAAGRAGKGGRRLAFGQGWAMAVFGLQRTVHSALDTVHTAQRTRHHALSTAHYTRSTTHSAATHSRTATQYILVFIRGGVGKKKKERQGEDMGGKWAGREIELYGDEPHEDVYDTKVQSRWVAELMEQATNRHTKREQQFIRQMDRWLTQGKSLSETRISYLQTLYLRTVNK